MIQSMTLIKPARKLQDQFTTPEQSGILIEMGVPYGLSADCYYEFGKIKVRTEEQLYEDFFHDNCIYIPCWSVGRLIEIAHICSDSPLSYKEEVDKIQKFKEEHKCETLIEAVILCITDAVSIGSIDFSKREYV